VTTSTICDNLQPSFPAFLSFIAVVVLIMVSLVIIVMVKSPGSVDFANLPFVQIAIGIGVVIIIIAIMASILSGICP